MVLQRQVGIHALEPEYMSEHQAVLEIRMSRIQDVCRILFTLDLMTGRNCSVVDIFRKF